MPIMSANEAKEKSTERAIKLTDEIKQFVFTEFEGRIDFAVKSGNSSIEINMENKFNPEPLRFYLNDNLNLKHEVIKTLKDLGYKVESTIDFFKVSW